MGRSGERYALSGQVLSVREVSARANAGLRAHRRVHLCRVQRAGDRGSAGVSPGKVAQHQRRTL